MEPASPPSFPLTAFLLPPVPLNTSEVIYIYVSVKHIRLHLQQMLISLISASLSILLF